MFKYLSEHFDLKQNLSWEADRRSGGREIPHLSWNPKIHYRVRNWSLSRARLIQYSPSRPVFLRFILILSSHLRLSLPSGLFPSVLPNHNLVRILVYPTCATCPAHPILLNLIVLIIFIEECKLWRRIPSWQANSRSADKIFPAVYRNRSYITLPQNPAT
jgi:hypothetical protein